MKENFIFGIRPVIEALRDGKKIDRVLLKHDLNGERKGELLGLLKEYRIPAQRVPVERLNRLTDKNHQGVVAFIASVEYYSLEDILQELDGRDKVPFILILDGITDVRNFGAIARTCECAGVDAIIIPEKGSVSIGPDAIKTSAGALLSIPVCREPNLRFAVNVLKSNGFRVVAASEKASVNYTDEDYILPTAIVMGNEEKGISYNVLKECSALVSIPQFGTIQSLNVSVACGVMIYEVIRQRMLKHNI